jgi:hypothetical protein
MAPSSDFDVPALLGLRRPLSIVHHLPGRLRIKGSHFHCHGERAPRADAAGAFGKALVGVLVRRTATRLIGALL